MERQRFDRYLEHFNQRDYDGLLKFWTDDFTVRFAGYEFRGAEEFINFYRFFHHYVDESVHVDEYLSDDRLLMIEARVRLECRIDLSAERLREAGYDRLVVMRKGDIVELPQFIHYRLEEGRFKSVTCALV